jgi:signal recognition particle GTPase
VVNVLDGTALLGAWDKVHLPTKIIGVGEGPNDLRDFEPDAYARQLLD